VLSDLLNAIPADTLVQALIDALSAKGYPITDWESGGVERTLLEVEAATLADLYKLVPTIAGSGFLQYAAGAWLDELALSEYNLTRKPSSFAVDTLTLTNTSSIVYTLRPGDIWVATANGLRFSSQDGGVIPAGGSLSVRVEAEHPGSAYNLPRNTLTVLMTPFPGVSASNSAALSPPASTPRLTTSCASGVASAGLNWAAARRGPRTSSGP
jgi:hypothetical protein